MKIRDLSLSYKFLAVMAVLLTAAIFVYLFLAVTLFEEDKTAFIYEGQGTLAGTLADQSAAELASVIKSMRLLTVTSAQHFSSKNQKQKALRSIFRSDANMVEFRLYKKASNSEPKLAQLFVDQSYLAPHNLRDDYFETVINQVPIPFDLAKMKKTAFENASVHDGIALLRITVAISDNHSPSNTLFAVAHVKTDALLRTFKRSEDTVSYLTDQYGNVLIHSDDTKMLAKQSYIGEDYIQSIITTKARTGAEEITDSSGIDKIISYSKISLGKLMVVSEIPKDKAFLATTRLKEKSAYFALLIVLICFMVSLLFTKTLTSALNKLYDATGKIAEGDFNIQVEAKGNDEVGVLARSFNYMAKRIIELLKETADKARMEKELETAHLVQENFFPIDELRVGPIELAAYFESASECGGDWWGHIQESKDSLYILIGDATGHGVPAALITAAAHSCCTTIKEFFKRRQTEADPAEIMDTLNKTIYHAGRGQVKMTFFVARIDLLSGELTYANASHELPFISHQPGDEHDAQAKRSREDLDTLEGTPGNILGQDPQSTYKNYTYQMRAGDVAVWFTDGLTECRNPDDEEYGENRLIRSFIRASNKEPKSIREELIDKARKFYGTRPIDDDITMVIMKVNQLAGSQQLAS